MENNCHFTDFVPACMHLDAYEPISFKLSMLADTSELNILILVSITLNLIQGHKGARYKHFSISYPTKFSDYTVEICWFDEHHTHFISSDQQSREKNQLRWFCRTNLIMACIRLFKDKYVFFKTCHYDIHYRAWHFDTSMHDHDLHSKCHSCTGKRKLVRAFCRKFLNLFE